MSVPIANQAPRIVPIRIDLDLQSASADRAETRWIEAARGVDALGERASALLAI